MTGYAMTPAAMPLAQRRLPRHDPARHDLPAMILPVMPLAGHGLRPVILAATILPNVA